MANTQQCLSTTKKRVTNVQSQNVSASYSGQAPKQSSTDTKMATATTVHRFRRSSL